MNKKLFIVASSAIIVVAALLVFMMNRSGDSTSDVVRFTAVLPLTGPLAHLGENEEIGMTLAIQELQARGECRIEFSFEDSQGNGATAVSIVQRAWDIEGQRFFVMATTGPTLATLPIFDDRPDAKLVIAQTMYPGVTRGHDYAFRLFPSSAQEAELLADHAIAAGNGKVAVLHVNNEWGLESVNIFRQRFESAGGSISEVETHGFADSDFRVILQKLLDDSPDSILIYTYPDFFPPIMDQLHTLGGSQAILANTDFAIGDIQGRVAPELLERTVFPAPRYFYDNNSDRVRDFNDRVREAGHTPNFDIATFYDMTMILNEAVSVSTGEDPRAVAEALSALGGYDGITGRIVMNEYRDVEVEFALARWVDGILQLIEAE